LRRLLASFDIGCQRATEQRNLRGAEPDRMAGVPKVQMETVNFQHCFSADFVTDTPVDLSGSPNLT